MREGGMEEVMIIDVVGFYPLSIDALCMYSLFKRIDLRLLDAPLVTRPSASIHQARERHGSE